MKEKLIIAFSGGRTSAFMTKWLIENKSSEYEILVVFSNTGKEREETLQFVHQCDKRFGFNVVWIEAVTNPEYGKGVRPRVVSFETASRNGEPFEASIAKHGIPNRNRPLCSRELKTNVIRAYARVMGWKKYFTAIGIRIDEPHRMNGNAKAERIIYPLISMAPTTKFDINKFWDNQDFDLRLKSYEGNCDMCWKKSTRKLLTLLCEKPERILWWIDMEKKYENYTPVSRSHNPNIKPPHRFFRGNRSGNDLLEASKQPFEPAIDESHLIDAQGHLFEKGEYGLPVFKDEEMDSANGCEESCEAF